MMPFVASLGLGGPSPYTVIVPNSFDAGDYSLAGRERLFSADM